MLQVDARPELAQRPPGLRYIVGVDLAAQSDYTALIVLESTPGPDHKPAYAVRHLERWHSAYPDTVRRVAAREADVRELGAPTELVVDGTGVGQPVVDMLREAKLKPVSVFIHGGEATARVGAQWRVPKRALVAHLQVVLQSGRLQIARSLSLADTLASELRGFKVEISSSGHDRYGNDVGAALWREADHDDLVLAVALAVWRAETKPKGPPPQSSFSTQSLTW